MSNDNGNGRVCSWRHVRSFDNFLRPLVHDPVKLFGPYIREGMTVMDVGCGRGFASLGLARLVGEGGKVISADLQAEMLAMVEERASSAGLSGRIVLHQCAERKVGVEEELDFVLAFWMVHELPDAAGFFREMRGVLKPEGLLFLAEPKIHDTASGFERTVSQATEVGFAISETPRVRLSRAVVLAKRGKA
jgi:ubiquinone/menaquinone biosynthesis C-methylase UbiE